MEKILTVFTPTYNRAYTLPRLYNSLLEQSNKGFKWVIVDDGSSDNTEEIVSRWILEDKIEIKYIKQENQGKHIAHNTGVENCETELFVCVDSDDYLVSTAVEQITELWDSIKYDNNIAGIVSLRISKDGLPIGGKYMPNGIDKSTLGDLYDKYKFKGDTMLTFKTCILKQYKFIKIEGEKFLGEEYIYSQIDSKYKLYVLNKGLYICEYLEDGYTNNIRNLIKNNPRGYMLLKKEKVKSCNTLKGKFKHTILYLVGCYLSKEKNIIRNSDNMSMCILATPMAIAYYLLKYK